MNVMYYRVVNSGYGLQYLPCAQPVAQGTASLTGTGLPSPSAPLVGAAAPALTASGLGACSPTPGLAAASASKWLYPGFSSSAAIQYLFRPRLSGPRQNKAVKCETCNITLNSEQQAQQHYSGKNHLKKIRQASGQDKEEGSADSPKTGKKRSVSEGDDDDDDAGSTKRRRQDSTTSAQESDDAESCSTNEEYAKDTDEVKKDDAEVVGPEEDAAASSEDATEEQSVPAEEEEEEGQEEQAETVAKEEEVAEEEVLTEEPQTERLIVPDKDSATTSSQLTSSPPVAPPPPLPVSVPSSRALPSRSVVASGVASVSRSSLLGLPQQAAYQLSAAKMAAAAAQPSFLMPQYRSPSLASSLHTSPHLYLQPQDQQQQLQASYDMRMLQPMYSSPAMAMDNSAEYLNALYSQQQQSSLKYTTMSAMHYDIMQQQQPYASTVYEALSMQSSQDSSIDQYPQQRQPLSAPQKLDPISQAVYDNLVGAVSSSSEDSMSKSFRRSPQGRAS